MHKTNFFIFTIITTQNDCINWFKSCMIFLKTQISFLSCMKFNTERNLKQSAVLLNIIWKVQEKCFRKEKIKKFVSKGNSKQHELHFFLNAFKHFIVSKLNLKCFWVLSYWHILKFFINMCSAIYSIIHFVKTIQITRIFIIKRHINYILTTIHFYLWTSHVRRDCISVFTHFGNLAIIKLTYVVSYTLFLFLFLWGVEISTLSLLITLKDFKGAKKL